MKKIKVCHVTVAHSATDNRIFHNEAKALVGAGYHVTIIVPNSKNETLDGVEIVGFDMDMNPIKRILIGSRLAYKKAILVDADIYHIHDIELFKYGVILANKGKKVIFDSHEDWQSYVYDIVWMPKFIRNLASKYIDRLYKKYLKSFDAVIAVSPHYMKKLQVHTSKVYLVTNYPKYDNNPKLFFSKKDYLDRGNNLFHAGTISNQKIVFDAINDISNIEYRMAGTFSEDYKEQLRKHSSWKKVKYLGYLTKDELSRAFMDSTIAITVLHYHANVGNTVGSMGNTKFFEYMKYGLPIICTDFKLWKELAIDKYNCGICVDPDNKKQILEAIIYLNSNREIAYKMGQNAQKAYFKEFNWGTQEKVLLKVYESILQKG